MAKRAAHQRDKRAPLASDVPEDRFERVRPWLLGAAAMLFVARPLIPSVNVEHQGNDAPFVMLWLLLATISLAVLWRSRHTTVRWSAVDTALLAVIALHSMSALVACWSGAAVRPAINMLWTWIAYGVSFAVVRQLLRYPAEGRALAAVMIALAVASCGYALHEYLVSQPATQAEYDRDPDAALRAIGQWYAPGSRERYLFEQRLRSTEPVATFALANSLAGFLAAWLVVAAGSLATLPEHLAARRRTIGAWVAIVAALLFVLLLTKSRSAVVGLSLGMAVLAASRYGRRHLLTRRALVAGAILVLGIVVAVAVGGLDLAVIGEAPRSLAFRFEYWQATWNMIAEQPIWGVGPGNFKDGYTAYKLPAASEEISDPHNFLLEVCATAGIATAAALVVFLSCVLLAAWRRDGSSHDAEVASLSVAQTPESLAGTRAIAAGGLCGWLLAFVLPYFAGPVIEVPLTVAALASGLLLGGFTLVLLWPWIAGGSFPAVVPLAALAALLVNLLAAGGIGHPAVAGSLWLLAALATTCPLLDGAAYAKRSERQPSATVLSLGLCLALALTVAAAATLYHPVVRSHLEIAAARVEHDLAEEHLTAAVDADSFGFEAHRLFAQARFESWRRQPTDASRKAFDAAAESWIECRPRSSEAWNQLGAWYLAIYQQSSDPACGELALDAYRRAVELYPNSAMRRARLAQAAAAVGDKTTARQSAAEALRLDALMPHAEQKLQELRTEMERMAPEGT